MTLYILIFLLFPTKSVSICEVFKQQDFWLSASRESRVCRWMPTVIKSAKDNGLEPSLLAAMITVESGWNHKVVSRADACGLTQVIPRYTGKITRKYTCDQLKNPYTSIKAGAKILRWWIDFHKGDISRGLCSYNAGFRCSYVRNKKGRIIKRPNKHGMRYSKKVLRQKQKIERVYNEMKREPKATYMPSSQR